VPSPVAAGRPVFADLPPGAGVDGDLTVKEGFLKDLSIRIAGQAWSYDADAGWIKVPTSAK
jgi:hypothetical protein